MTIIKLIFIRTLVEISALHKIIIHDCNSFLFLSFSLGFILRRALHIASSIMTVFFYLVDTQHAVDRRQWDTALAEQKILKEQKASNWFTTNTSNDTISWQSWKWISEEMMRVCYGYIVSLGLAHLLLHMIATCFILSASPMWLCHRRTLHADLIRSGSNLSTYMCVSPFQNIKIYKYCI